MPRASRKCAYSGPHIVATDIWAVEHERPFCWAVPRNNYHRIFRPRRLRSCGQFKRRVQSPRGGRMLNECSARLAGRDLPTPFMSVDGKALPVGGGWQPLPF